ncbi:MAG: hypothetical protein JNK53_06040 [Phycisphaerae bacterium]|nr:hypothetical protein [Phycisphaerae bacterium]
MDGLRAALIELYASVGADPSNPQDVARRFGVNKTLTWNIAKVVGGTDPLPTLQNVPGASALQILLTAVQREGASKEAVERVRKAARSLDQTVERHFGDRATLDLIVDGIRPRSGDHLELSRKLAFRGNSGLWGVQAKVRLMTAMLAPNPENPDRLDMALVRGYLGLRRLRSDIRWPIFQLRGWGGEGDFMTTEHWKPIEGSEDGTGALPLLKSFSTVAPTDIETKHTPRGLNYVLTPGPIGNTGAVDCYVADYSIAAAHRYRTEQDTTGEFGATISAPTERLIFDLIVHESLDFATNPEVKAFGGIFMDRAEDTDPDDIVPIPVPQEVAPLPGTPPVVATPLIPAYPDILSAVNKRLNWNPKQFRGCRLEITYPPMGSTILLRFKLPSQG